MGEKSRISKLGKLFGVSSGSDSDIPRDNKASSLVESLASNGQKKQKYPPLNPPAKMQPSNPSSSSLFDQEDGDQLYPLPNDRHLQPQIHTKDIPNPRAIPSPSPPHSIHSPVPSVAHSAGSSTNNSYENLVHPQPKTPTPLKSPPVSRLSSANSRKKPPILRSTSVKSPHPANPSTPTNAPSGQNSNTIVPSPKLRFRMFEDGSHEHNLRAAKRQEKLTNMLKDLLGAKKLRDEAKSAVPNILLLAAKDDPANKPKDGEKEKPPTLFAGLVSQVKNNTLPYHLSGGDLLDPMSHQDCRSFVEKYGRCQEVIGRGSFGVVRISHKKPAGAVGSAAAPPKQTGAGETLYAVKEFKKRPNESEKKYSRRLTSEFCILSSLKDINIIDTLDLLKDAKGDYCEVMEFCLGGDLYTLIIAAGKLEYAEADCFFKQLIRGVNYMHDMGVAHRDLKPENLLLTQQGVLKITDFGNGECFRMAWEDDVQLSEGVCGSSPYIAPEEFTQEQFDPRCVDIWACGVIYMAMRTGRQLWKLANPRKDEFFDEYLRKRKDATGYEPIEALKRARCRNVIYSILDPLPSRRITGKQILNSEWGREIKVCAAARPPSQGPLPLR